MLRSIREFEATPQRLQTERRGAKNDRRWLRLVISRRGREKLLPANADGRERCPSLRRSSKTAVLEDSLARDNGLCLWFPSAPTDSSAALKHTA